jgi:hypothetical protein
MPKLCQNVKNKYKKGKHSVTIFLFLGKEKKVENFIKTLNYFFATFWPMILVL